MSGPLDLLMEPREMASFAAMLRGGFAVIIPGPGDAYSVAIMESNKDQFFSLLRASFLAAVLLAIAARYLQLTDEDLAILGPVMLILAGVVIRAGVFSPATVGGLARDKGTGGS